MMTQYAKRISVMEEENRKLASLAGSLTATDVVSFGAGAPAVEAYPFDILREISQEVFQNTPLGIEAVKYGSTYGTDAMRAVVKDLLLAPAGLHVEKENIMITAGGIEPMNFLCQLFINPGDVILVEAPTFVHATTIFKMFEAQIVSCSMDDNGLVIEEVEEKIKKYKPKMVYTVPTFHNPTGITLNLERRKALAELGSKYDVIILEDDPYREIRYSGEALPYIKSFDKDGHTVLANSFSKIFSPGARLGYVVADKEIIKQLDAIKLGTDTCTNGFAQAICSEFFRQGYYPQHLENLRNLYRSRRDVMLESLDKYFPAGTKHTMPDGGYYVWVELPEPLDALALSGEIREALHICYGIGAAFFSEGTKEGQGNRFMRLNFTGLDEKTIQDKLKELGEYFQSKM